MLAAILTLVAAGGGQNGAVAQTQTPHVPPPDLGAWNAASEVAGVIERYVDDRDLLRRSLAAPTAPNGRASIRDLQKGWLASLTKADFAKLSHDGQLDWLLLRNHLQAAIRRSEIDEEDYVAADALIPHAKSIWELREAMRRMEQIEPERVAATLTDLEKSVKVETDKLDKAKEPPKVSAGAGIRALEVAAAVKDELKEWFEYSNGYDPLFSWWVSEPYKRLDAALETFGKELREKLQPEGKEPRVAPIGAEALKAELEAEMIPYSAEELVKIAEKEFAWCEAEMRKASREMGFGDDWKKALEKVKGLHVEPGKQPEMIKELALEAIDFVEKHKLLTVPELAKQTWRMTMMSPERQRTSPFFLGGEVIMVSYPTNTMTHEEKLMSMRGNNRHFARATVHHELIPGHHLQGFMTKRYRPYRQLFSTPFWVEGWALYWEFLLWEKGFPKTPENRVGMLFWRMHRCARIVFSLSYHLGTMTPEQCVDFLVERVGHERANADAEVRRSFNGTYPPLYQAAYMLGALQLWQLRRELVDSGKMKERDFHDAVLRENSIPIEMLRAILAGEKLSTDFATRWRFYSKL